MLRRPRIILLPEMICTNVKKVVSISSDFIIFLKIPRSSPLHAAQAVDQREFRPPRRPTTQNSQHTAHNSPTPHPPVIRPTRHKQASDNSQLASARVEVVSCAWPVAGTPSFLQLTTDN